MNLNEFAFSYSAGIAAGVGVYIGLDYSESQALTIVALFAGVAMITLANELLDDNEEDKVP